MDLVPIPPPQKGPRRDHLKVVVPHFVIGQQQRAGTEKERRVQPEPVLQR